MVSKKILTIGAVSVAALAAPVFASHSWSTYHWERTTPEIAVPVVDFTTGEWAASNRTFIAVQDWNDSDFIQSPYSRGDGTNTSCPLISGQIHVCNDDYGPNGWLGIAGIATTRGKTKHIIAGYTKVNDTYFDRDPPGQGYNTDVWRQLVMCQEIGHDYGLGHQNEDFNTSLTDSCMEYQGNPDSKDKTPDAHDFAQLADIYAHSHGTDGGGGGNGNGRGKKLGLSGTGPADWGTPIGRDAQGRPNIYRRSEASFDVITHVTWAIGEGPDHHDDHTEGHNGPRQHSGDLHF